MRGAVYLGAAYRNRTDDLRITSSRRPTCAHVHAAAHVTRAPCLPPPLHEHVCTRMLALGWLVGWHQCREEESRWQPNQQPGASPRPPRLAASSLPHSWGPTSRRAPSIGSASAGTALP